MRFLETDTGWRVLLRQRDLHLILLMAGIDLGLTVPGILQGGTEANPFFAPLTGSLTGMVGGILFYAVVLLTASLVLRGEVRSVLGSVAFGMHVGGATTWILFYTDPGFNIFWYSLVVALATAAFYHRCY